MNALCFSTATALRELIRSRRASVTEIVQAHLAQIERVNPQVNAIVTLCADQALAEARAADAALARGEAVGPLHGLPVAHKDLVPTEGIRTTSGSPIYGDHVPEHDALIVERMQGRGRHHHRQDQHARVRRRLADVQRGVRRDAATRTTRPRPAAAAAAARRWRWPAA